MKLMKFLNFDNKTIVVVSIILIALLLLIRIYGNIEFFQDASNDRVEFDKVSTSTTGILFGNALIMRDGSNLEISNFGPDSDKMKVILNSEGVGPTALQSAEIKVSLNFTKRIEAIRIQGMQKFNIKYSLDDEAYFDVNDGTVNNVTEQLNNVYVNEQSNTVKTFSVILNKNEEKVTAKYLKIISLDTEKGSNIKVEFYGVNAANADKKTLTSNIYPIVGLEMYNENNYPIGNNPWTAESNNRRPHLMIKMPGKDLDTVGNTNYLVSYLSVKSNVHSFKVRYSSTNTTSVYTIPCNELINGNVNSDLYETYYFPQPTLVNYIALYPIGGSINNENYTIKDVKVSGRLISSDDYNRYLSQSASNCEGFKNTKNTIEGFSSPNTVETDQLMTNLQNTDKLCRALEYQDLIRNEKNKLERNKQYLIKLKDQEDEIIKLEKLIKNLKENRKSRQDAKDLYNLARYEKQAGEEAKTIELAKSRLENQKKMNVNLNFMPQQ